ncbi:MAG: alpha/beta fold hydrolase [Desulfobacterales bacterium]|nr:alpha/beta fold hydrolase [Desulfobacterales bacterium]
MKDTARFKDNVFLMAPYRPGRIPLVLVHGTASSPARWAQMLNEIINDRELWNRYQVWLFTYNTGNPILYSGGILARKACAAWFSELDPEGKDPALRKMVVVGHSQGGLLDEADRHRQRRRVSGISLFNVPHRSARRLARGARTAPAQPLLRAPALCAPGRLHLPRPTAAAT